MLKHPLLNLVRANRGRGAQFKVDNAANGEVVFWLYDVIGEDPWTGEGIDPLEVAQALAGLNGAPVRFRIHSPGGDAFDGRAIATAIGAYSGPTIAQVDGYAVSAASYVALAADRVEMAPGSFLMIHEGYTLAMGTKGDMLQCAAMLETFDNSLIADYARQTGQTPEQIQTWLEAETWFEADAAVAAGFADAVLTDADGVLGNRFDLSAYTKAPEKVRAAKPPVKEPEKPAPKVESGDSPHAAAIAEHAARQRRAGAIARRA
jgi:ATP-dependent Clp protease protease subunit